MSQFAGKSAVVTGAASGIGFALCLELCRRGAIVYAADLNEEGLDTLKRSCSDGLVTQVLNVTDEDAVESLLQRVLNEQSSLDYLFNNAGIVVGGNFEDMDASTWQKIVDINLWGVVYGCQHGYAQMLKQGYGHIINTASTAGLTPVAKSSAYAATKHAVVGLSTSLREEAREHGVRVSVAIPGLVDTNIFSTATNLDGHDYDAEMNKVPINKITPHQAAMAMLKGVEKNQQFIIFPGYNKLIVAMNRLLPGMTAKLINR